MVFIPNSSGYRDKTPEVRINTGFFLSRWSKGYPGQTDLFDWNCSIIIQYRIH